MAPSFRVVMLGHVEQELLTCAPLAQQLGKYQVISPQQWQEGLSSSISEHVDMFVVSHDVSKNSSDAVSGQQSFLAAIASVRSVSKTAFVAAWHSRATEDAFLRVEAWEAGANMVTCYADHLAEAMRRVASQRLDGSITCDWCGMQGLSPIDYHLHHPLYHVNHVNLQGTCQVCGYRVKNIARHLHNAHAPPGHEPEERTGVFSLAVVRRPSDGRFLLTQEFAKEGFWLPGGGVDPGESLTAAALREAKEEAGVEIRLLGVLHLDYMHGGQWRRVIFYAEPVDENQQPKTVPDFDGAGACWVDVDQLPALPLRSPSELKWVVHVANGGAVLPMQIPAEWKDKFDDWPF